jgi:hypothetical protein
MLDKAKALLQQWVDKQGHDRCWYYPDIFTQLCTLLGVKPTTDPSLPPRAEFEKGCARYQSEEYGSPPKVTYLIFNYFGNPEQTTSFACTGNELGMVHDRKMKVLRLQDGRYQQLRAVAEESPRFRWIPEWEDVPER